jgi:hypothetical protein
LPCPSAAQLERGTKGFCNRKHSIFASACCCLWLAIFAVSRCCGKPLAADISFADQVRLGNVFVDGEIAQIQAWVANGDALDWTVTDYKEQQLASGTATVGGHQATVATGVNGRGFYLVHLTAKVGDKVVGQAVTSYTVLRPTDVSKMADSKFGVMTHFAQGMPTDVLPLIAKAGIANVRDELYWGTLEKVAGKFDFTVENDRYTRYMALLAEAHVTPLEVMTFGNPNYDQGDSPFTPEGDAAYANYCVSVLDHYGPQIRALEIWNEYNGSFCKGPALKDRPKYYTQMLRAAYARIKTAHPNVTVVGGALVKIPMPYIEKLFKAGALQSMDAIAVHPYRATPEGVEREVGNLIELMKKYNNGQAKPIWVTETGNFSDHSISRAANASYLVRMYTLLLTQPEVARVYWYLSRDYREFKTMGLLHADDDPMGRYTPTMAYCAYANLIAELDRANFVRREQTDPRTRAYQFEREGKRIWVCYSTSGQTQLTLATGANVLKVNIVGGDITLVPENGQLLVTIGEQPIYLVADKGSATQMSEVARPDRVIADSVDDFAGPSSGGNWSYFWYESNRDGSAPYLPGNVQPMSWKPTRGDWDDCWRGPGEYLDLSQAGTNPAARGGKQLWTLRRWTSDMAGLIHLHCQVSRGDPHGDGVTVKIFLDGKLLRSEPYRPQESRDIDLSFEARKGSQVDFAVTPGPGTDSLYDGTGFRATLLCAIK